MFTIRADNRILTEDARFSYLLNNYASGVSAVVVVNSAEFAADDYILFESIGTPTAEIVKISTVTSATNTLNLATSTVNAHSESVRVTIIPYNQVKFYWTSTTTYATTGAITTYLNVNPANIYSHGNDATHTTGYGWFVFYNSTTETASDHSNYVPYAGFSRDAVATLIERIYSTIADSDKKLLNEEDLLVWINDGYGVVKDELNLVNREYNTSEELTLTITAGTQEYALDDDFSDLVYLRTYNSSNTADTKKLLSIAIRDIPDYLAQSVGDGSLETRYYKRMVSGTVYVGLVPIPIEDDTYKYVCRRKASTLDAYSDILGLPNSAFIAVQEYALKKAYTKLKDNRSGDSKQEFNENVARMKNVGVSTDDELSSWGISDDAWV